jgi:predicted ATPase
LLVVDNCEHVLAAVADAVERIVARCSTVTVLATSREPLMVRGERLVPVPSLAPQDAERLFLERARDETPELVMDDVQRRAVVELCRRLDGLPLALELAASRVRAFTPVELVSHLEERFRLLVGGRRSQIERHQTMRGTLDWSYDLCSDMEQAVFDRLSVFPAGFDLAAARAVGAGAGVSELQVVDAVLHLLDRSLLQRLTAADGTTRFRLLETMRAYGREHLQHHGIADATRETHARYVARTVGALTLRRFGPDEDWVVRRLHEYLPDALVTLDWSIEHHEWDVGLHVIHAGRPSAEREANEMLARLHQAALAGGAPIEVLDELASWDAQSAATMTIGEADERGWRIIRAKMPIPPDRVVLAPFADVAVTGANVGEFVSSLEHWRSAPSASRFWAEYLALRSLACSLAVRPELDPYVDPLVEEFAAFVNALNSARASQRLAEVRGLVARQRRNWSEAVKWYGQIVRSRTGGPPTLFTLADAWNLMTVRSLDTGPFEITGAELREPWLTYHDLRADSMRWGGATSTALALQRLGHTALADRFAAWARRHDTVGIMSTYYDVVLEIAGLPTAPVDGDDDLETLVRELFVMADRLDVAARRTG